MDREPGGETSSGAFSGTPEELRRTIRGLEAEIAKLTARKEG